MHHQKGAAKPGASLAIGHFYLSLWADYSRFSFNTLQRNISTSLSERALSTSGFFSEWRAALELNYRF